MNQDGGMLDYFYGLDSVYIQIYIGISLVFVLIHHKHWVTLSNVDVL